jgi:hypothetical protein
MPNKPSAVANAIGHIDDRAAVIAKDDAGDPCRASLKGVPFTCKRTPLRATRENRSTPTPPTVIPPVP